MLCSGVPRPAGVLLAVLLAAGCASNEWRREVLSSDREVFLYKEHRQVEGAVQPLGLAHPLDLPGRDAEALFSRLAYVDSPLFGMQRELPVFNRSQARRLAVAVAAALSEVGPDERIRFLVTDNRFASVFRGATGTSGVVFATSPETLHIAFDAIHEGINDGPGGRPDEVIFPYDPTRITDADPLAAFPAGRRHRDPETGAGYPRWLEVDRKELAALSPLEEPIAAAGTRAAHAGGGGTPEGQGRGGDAEAEEARYQELRRKLEWLKRLRADGVLTQEEYETQYEALLNDS